MRIHELLERDCYDVELYESKLKYNEEANIPKFHDDWWNLDELEEDLANDLKHKQSLVIEIKNMVTKQILVKNIDDRLQSQTCSKSHIEVSNTIAKVLL